MQQQDQPRNTYLVGGAVRDGLLGLPHAEKDWVVVGSSAAEMKAAGYTQVGKDFPVYLHPVNKEEYALARTERKVQSGHTGFETDINENITLEEDLRRRDLTINAIAQDAKGNIIDPYHGCQDLESKTIRHVSEAFEEDPLRVLRVARFAAKLASLGFCVADETRDLCESMVKRGDLSELPAERIFQEMNKALETDHSEVFFRFLDAVSAGNDLWPELNESAFDLLARSAMSASKLQRFAILFSQSPVDLIRQRCGQLKTPNQYQSLAIICSQYLQTWAMAPSLPAAEIVEFLYNLDAIRKPDRFLEFSRTCWYITETRAPEGCQHENWANFLSIISAITSTNVDATLSGPAIGKAIRRLQIEAIDSFS